MLAAARQLPSAAHRSRGWRQCQRQHSGLAYRRLRVPGLAAVLIDGGASEMDDSTRRMLEILHERGTRVVRLPDDELFRPGPRAIAALPELLKALHPDAVPGVTP